MTTTINASTTAGLVQTADTSGILQLQTANTAAVTVDASQNVGIGTTSPAQKLSVSAPSGLNIVQFTATTGTNECFGKFSNSGGDFWIGLDSSTGATFGPGAYSANIYYAGAYPLKFWTNNTERMRIDSSGNLLVGTTSVLNAGLITEVFNGASQNGIVLKTTYASTGSTYITFRNSAGNEAGYITQNGTTTVNYVTTSDYRLKENIKPIENALDKISKLKPVTYTWKDTDGEIGEGFIAHELAEVCPLAVSGEKDAVNEDGSIKSQGIDQSKLVATLTAAIQELKAIVDAQQQEINALKGAQQ